MNIFHNYNCLLQRNNVITAEWSFEKIYCAKNRLTHNHLVLCIESLPEVGKSLLRALM